MSRLTILLKARIYPPALHALCENHIAEKKVPKRGITLPPIYCLPDADVQRRDFSLFAYYVLL